MISESILNQSNSNYQNCKSINNIIMEESIEKGMNLYYKFNDISNQKYICSNCERNVYAIDYNNKLNCCHNCINNCPISNKFIGDNNDLKLNMNSFKEVKYCVYCDIYSNTSLDKCDLCNIIYLPNTNMGCIDINTINKPSFNKLNINYINISNLKNNSKPINKICNICYKNKIYVDDNEKCINICNDCIHKIKHNNYEYNDKTDKEDKLDQYNKYI